MRKRIWISLSFALSSITLLISLKLFWNIGIYVDKYNTSPSIVFGSDFWLYMAWLRLLLLGTIVVMSAMKLLSIKKNI